MKLVKVFDSFPAEISKHIDELFWYVNDRKMIGVYVSLDVPNMDHMIPSDRLDFREAFLGLNHWLLLQGAELGEKVIFCLRGKFDE